MKISEGLASLTFKPVANSNKFFAALMENNVAVNDSGCSEFYSSPPFAFLSNDQIINLFLNVFKTKKHVSMRST